MTFIQSWIEDAIASLGIASEVSLVTEPERSRLLESVIATFLATPSAKFWWETLKLPEASWQTEGGYKHLSALAPSPQSPAYLIAGLSDFDEEKLIFRITPALAVDLIGECPGFEYALVDATLRWLVIENHHDFLIAVGECRERLLQLSERGSA